MTDNPIASVIGSSIDKAVASLKGGGVVAFPTETYYGLAVDAGSPSAVAHLFRVKKRAHNKPLLVLIDNQEQLHTLVKHIPVEYIPLMEKYWPGPLTLVFPAKKGVNSLLTGGTGTIGVRISSHPLAGDLVREMGKPITATSANLSGLPPASDAVEVLEMFKTDVSFILDGGKSRGGLCSTILGVHKGKCMVLRHGQVDLSGDMHLLQSS